MLMQDFELSLSVITDATAMNHSCNLNKTYCSHLDNTTVLIVLINWIHNDNALQEKRYKHLNNSQKNSSVVSTIGVIGTP